MRGQDHISGFVWLRVIRIVPALAVEVTLSAVVLGAVFTTLPLADYFSSPVLLNYFRNIYGDIHFLLPGVFEDNPLNIAVNISLWTIPYEFECYSVLIFLMATRLINIRVAIAMLTAAGCIALFVKAVYFSKAPIQTNGSVDPRAMVLAFLAGVSIYLFRDKVQLRPAYFIASAALALLAHQDRHWALLGCFPAAYATVYLGLLNPSKPRFIFDGDYSYGVYLYACPIQQTIAHLMPESRAWWSNFLFSIPLVFAFSYVSWHFVEKHALKLKRIAAKTSLIPTAEVRLMQWIAHAVLTTLRLRAAR